MSKTMSEIVDAICNAMNKWGMGEYDPTEFYYSINGQHPAGNKIARAMDAGTNEDVINAISLCLRSHFHPEDSFLQTLLSWVNREWI